MHYYFFGAIIAILLVWSVGSYIVVRSVEKPSYTVVEEKEGYEIREYKAYIAAETTVTGNLKEATNQGFRIIADYIFGNNTKKESISMTTPVLESQADDTSEKISMTTPVLERSDADTKRTISFILPSSYTLETLPTPNNSAVQLVEVQARKVAALKFTWYATEDRVNAKKSELLELLARDQKVIIGDIETARYNPPLSMPLLLRNEILVPIE